jgi:hypothetical protein
MRMTLPYRLLVALSLALLHFSVTPRSALPADQQAPRPPAVDVVVDPRVELMSIIFRLAGNPEYNQGRVPSYIKDVDEHFGKFRQHPAVEMAGNLRRTRGVGFDACMSLAIHLGDAYTVSEKLPLDPRPASLDGRWKPDEAREFLAALKQFVEEAALREFIENHRPLYAEAESRMKALLAKESHLEWFEAFFGARPQARFTIALGMVNGPCNYGVLVRLPDGKEELYCVLGVWQTDKQGQPQFTREVLPTVIHEFCHSHTNAVVDRHAEKLQAAGEKIFPRVAAALQRQAYGNWRTMMYESMVRACVIRYTRQYDGRIAAWLAVLAEKSRGFPWMGDLVDLLGQYEEDRQRYPTLDAFFPRVVEFFNHYADDSAAK